MFTFGTNEHGGRGCGTCPGSYCNRCECYCENSASSDGTCTEVEEIKRDLYRFNYYGEGKTQINVVSFYRYSINIEYHNKS